jgi:hypothetical protein
MASPSPLTNWTCSESVASAVNWLPLYNIPQFLIKPTPSQRRKDRKKNGYSIDRNVIASRVKRRGDPESFVAFWIASALWPRNDGLTDNYSKKNQLLSCQIWFWFSLRSLRLCGNKDFVISLGRRGRY